MTIHTSEVTISPIHILTPAEVNEWLESAFVEWIGNLEQGSVSLLEHLTNDIESPNDPSFDLRISQAGRFLARLDNDLDKLNDHTQGKLAIIFGVLMSFLVEAGPYRFEVKQTSDNQTNIEFLEKYRAIRIRALPVSVRIFDAPIFDPIREAIEREIKPLLNSICEQYEGKDDRYMPFRVLLVGAVAEQLRFIALRIDDGRYLELENLLRDMYQLKYLRFGTSGYRGIWERDFTENKVRIVTQAICDFLKLQNMPRYATSIGEDLAGRVIVIGYDGRRNSPLVAKLVAETCLANGFQVYYSSCPTPTPALNFFAREVIGRDHLAGLINCTASHNPPEWQGIKFNPKEGNPAPTNLTDIIASRATARQLLNTSIPRYDITLAESNGLFQQFDPKDLYLDWIRKSGQQDGNSRRLRINLDAIKSYFSDKWIVLDPMYGSGRGYLSKLLGELGIPHTSIHDERDEDLGWQTEKIRGIPHLEYANPEPDFIQPLVDTVIAQDAALGLGLDTDADRFGAVDHGGVYIRPNQILAMLTRYLGIDRQETGRVIITQTGLPMIDALAQKIPNNETHRPPKGTVPAYIAHAFYKRRVGREQDIVFPNTYVVPVGIKYIIDVARIPESVSNPEDAYKVQPDTTLPDNWMDRLLIGGEESSGLTTRGHIPDKDGIWANLLILDMLAYYGSRSEDGQTSLSHIWKQTTEMDVTWKTYGDRIDLDTTIEAKEGLLNYFLDIYKDWKPGDPLPQLADLDIYYLGGTRYDFVEIFLMDAHFGKKHFLRVRSSGTEPITRVYIESADSAIANRLLETVLDRLDTLNVDVISQAYSIERLADVLSNTRFAKPTAEAVDQVLQERGWDVTQLCVLLEKLRPHVESRNAKLINEWVNFLK